MALAFSAAAESRIQEAIAGSLDKQAALLPVLYIAQDEFGYLPREALELVAERLSLPYQQVESVTSFYGMFKRHPVGRYHIQLCRTLSCALMGAGELREHLRTKLGVGPNQVTPDGRFSYEEVECLAMCGSGPAMQINKTNYTNLSIEKIDAILAELD